MLEAIGTVVTKETFYKMANEYHNMCTKVIDREFEAGTLTAAEYNKLRTGLADSYELSIMALSEMKGV